MTAEDILKLHLGNLMVQIASLQAALEQVSKENEALKAATAAPSAAAETKSEK